MAINKLFTPSELATALGISIETIYAWTSQKKIPYIKIGRLVRFNLDAVNDWLDKRKVEPYE